MLTLRTALLVVLAGSSLLGCAPDDAELDAATPDATAVPPAPEGMDQAWAAWAVTDSAFGPLRDGMTVAVADSLLDGRFDLAELADPACGVARIADYPHDVSFLVVEGRLARVDVRDTTVATQAGARVGDTEAEILSRYPSAVATPHKYTDGQYLTVTPGGAGAATHRLVFETEGGRVTTYRAGRLPAVEWVEGCS